MPLYDRVLSRVRTGCCTSASAILLRAHRVLRFSARRCCSCRSSAPSSCHTSTRARCGCARRCRTRSRSTKRRSSAPQVRNILLGFPQVTTVANELGRPDDGTDPTGFFNNEYFVGLKPTTIRPGVAPSTTRRADRCDQAEAAGVPGHHLQLHAAGRGRGGRSRDRPQELLAVKIFGADLAMLETKAEAVQRIDLARCPAFAT